MNWLDLWTQTPIARALGWTLLHSFWEGAAVAALLAAALCVFRSPRARYAAACFALLALLAGFAVTLAALWPAAGGAAAVPRIDLTRVVPTESGPFNAPPIQFRAADLLPWLAPFWILGVFAFHLRALAGWLGARRLRRSGVCCAPGDWDARLARLAARLRISRPVKLLESSLADAPLVIAHLRPVILMPVGLFAGLPASQVEAILAHELAHILRRDYLVNLLQTFIEGLLFYHPAVWWMSRVISAERENCCDDMAIAVCGDARDYAAALAALEQNRFASRELALAATGGSLVNRIRRILKYQERSRVGLAPLASAIVLTLATAVCLAAWQTAPAPAPAPKPEPQAAALASPAPEATPAPAREQQTDRLPSAQIPNPYRKWLTEDVAYIITDEERAAFKSLQADDQRETFIEQFWLKRDPTPGTPENEMKDEHYRRIAYANARFGSSIPGWKTDRGRIYIQYGPPDEIDDHSSGGVYRRPPEEGGGEIQTVPFQQWRYRYIEGIGNNVIIEFIDPARNGEFRMTTDPWAKNAANYPAPTPPVNSFISVGGDPQITVNVGTGGAVKVTLEQDAMAGRFELSGNVASGSQVAANLKDHLDIGADPAGRRLHYDCGFHLAPGSYVFNVAVKDPSGAIHSQSVSFYVN